MSTVMSNCTLAVFLLLLAVFSMESHSHPYRSNISELKRLTCNETDVSEDQCSHGTFHYTQFPNICSEVKWCYRGLNDRCRPGKEHNQRCHMHLTCHCGVCQNCDKTGCILKSCPFNNDNIIGISKRLMQLIQARHQLEYQPIAPNQLEYPIAPINQWEYQPVSEELYQM